MKTTGRRLTVPVMNYILLSLLPLILSGLQVFLPFLPQTDNLCFSELPFTGILLPHEKMKMNPVEDIAIARLYKKNHIPVACLVGDDTIQCRMYEGYQAAVHGFSKNVTAFFGNSFLLAILFWLITTAGLSFIAIWLPLPILILYLAFIC